MPRIRILCEHGKRKYRCKDCGGSSICEHGKQKSRCKDCGGSSMCEHGKQKKRCKDCGGSYICEHGKQKHICKDCGGSSICEHGKRKHICTECLSLHDIIASNRFCHCTAFLSRERIRSGKKQCAKCDPSIVNRVEHIVRDRLLPQIIFPVSSLDELMFGNGCDVVKGRRPDFIWLGDYRSVTKLIL
eukprot:1700263-Prymnesium_polylepis.1